MSIISTDVQNSITNLLTMDSTLSTVKTVSSALLALPSSETTAKENSSDSSDSKFSYDSTMDYNKDGAVTIGERLTSYTLQLGAELSSGSSDTSSLVSALSSTPTSTSSTSSSTTSSNGLSDADNLKLTYEQGQAAINQKLIASAYGTSSSSKSTISGFNISV